MSSWNNIIRSNMIMRNFIARQYYRLQFCCNLYFIRMTKLLNDKETCQDRSLLICHNTPYITSSVSELLGPEAT
uniref:Uncharacterized protein n=1 Tax=Lepeophtheirus salmonis TaxID=72036 RepID=A0A0K2TQI3_LEPSM